MRGPAEIAYRLRQETANLRLFAHPPRLPDGVVATSFATPPAPAPNCDQIAAEILAHRFPILGLTIETGPEIRWRRDYISGIETPPVYFRRIPYLDAARVGDHKIIWELNRHQHLVVLAQTDHIDEIRLQIESWLEQN